MLGALMTLPPGTPADVARVAQLVEPEKLSAALEKSTTIPSVNNITPNFERDKLSPYPEHPGKDA